MLKFDSQTIKADGYMLKSVSQTLKSLTCLVFKVQTCWNINFESQCPYLVVGLEQRPTTLATIVRDYTLHLLTPILPYIDVTV